MSVARRIPVTILGATGTVGQQFVRLLATHPWFEIASLCASARSAGRRYADAVHWHGTDPIPEHIAGMDVLEAAPGVPGVVAFSALDAAAAETLEPAFAAAGAWVVSNARSYRLEPDVPLLIPELNADTLDATLTRQRARGWTGGLITNPNCAAVVLAAALAPLHRAFTVERVVVTTLQAVSGAGYPGVASLDILGNVIPYIGGGEEEKIEHETRKLLDASFPVAAHVTRVPVLDGHTITVSAAFRNAPSPADAAEVLRRFATPDDIAALPGAPVPFLAVHDAPDRPQPRLDAGLGGGMTVSVGRIRPCPALQLRFVAMAHNTLRGAAGAAVLNAELLAARGLVPGLSS